MQGISLVIEELKILQESCMKSCKIIIDGLLEKLSLLAELDNPITVATLSSVIEAKERNEKHSLQSFDKDWIINIYADQDIFL